MTSKISFVSQLKETLHRHLASTLITLLVFIIHLISFFLNFQNTINAEWMDATEKASYIYQALVSMCSPSLLNGILAFLLGAYLAFDYFRYMHSKSETDLYNALPVRKTSWFKTLFICSFCVFAVLCTIAFGLELAIVFGFGYGEFVLFQRMLWNLLCMLGIYLASWAAMTLAMFLTGHSIIAFLGYGVFSVYVPILLSNLIPVYSATFFDTYTSVYRASYGNYFSPLTLMYKLVKDYNYDGWKASEHLTYFAGIWIFALLVGILSYFLFLRRPSEACGRAMTFEKTNPVIRILLVVPIALYMGIFLRSMSEYFADAWMIFGILFAAFLVHGILECIFQFDIRALFCKKKQLLFTCVFCLGFVCIFWFDLFHYDEYLPDADDVECVHISIDDYSISAYGKWQESKDGLSGEYLDDALCAAYDMVHSPEVDFSDGYYSNITFAYQLKNGTTKYRCYAFNVEQIPDSLDQLFATEAYKNEICSLYTTDRSNYTAILYANGIDTDVIELTSTQRDELIDTYLEEYTALTLSQHYSEPVLLQIGFQQAVDENDYYDTKYFSVYANFQKTLHLLEQYDVNAFFESEGFELISVAFYDKKYGQQEILFTDLDKTSDLSKNFILCEFNHYFHSDEWIYCTLKVRTSNGEQDFDVYVNESVIDTMITP